jgi:glutamyl-tRNA synthetase
MTQKIRTRFAPSPTGFIHLGNIRSALYPWAFARANGGDFILRIEDTDLDRSTQAAVDVIIEGMSWLGLSYDEGPFYQMQRMDRYKEVLANCSWRACLPLLHERGRTRLPARKTDGCQGKAALRRHLAARAGQGCRPFPKACNRCCASRIRRAARWCGRTRSRAASRSATMNSTILVIARPDGTPTYNFCVVVDDIDMEITHVIRGDDHVNNTPRQINIFQALGKEPPVYAHLPTVLNELGEKMSKRNGAKPVTQYRDEGYLPDAMVNYLARLGWSHGDDEIFSREQFLQWFNLDHLGAAPRNLTKPSCAGSMPST